MKRTGILLFAFIVFSGTSFRAAALPSANFFTEVEKTLKTGNVDKLANWFPENLEVDILGISNICSKNQAKQILKKFFAKYTAKNFTLKHQSGKGKVQYCIGDLIAGGESFRVTIFVQNQGMNYMIQQMRIEKSRN